MKASDTWQSISQPFSLAAVLEEEKWAQNDMYQHLNPITVSVVALWVQCVHICNATNTTAIKPA